MGIFGRDDDDKKDEKKDVKMTKDPGATKDFGRKEETAGRARPDFSNVQSGSTTEAAAPKAAGSQSYTVESGDSLSKISQRFYGDANAWRRIFEANRDRIDDPDMIQPGWTLTIPAAENKAGAP
ncbi:MAG: LysM peptidoglycan-binding domain-containing protein [Gemmatimonadota bacterium]